MAENLSNEFKQEVLEAEIKRLSAEIEKYKELPEGHLLDGQEIVKKTIQSMVPVPPQTAVPSQPSNGTLPDYVTDAPVEAKLEIEYLINMALNNGLDKANAAAMKSSAFVVDSFHDAMASKLYPELQKRGILK